MPTCPNNSLTCWTGETTFPGLSSWSTDEGWQLERKPPASGLLQAGIGTTGADRREKVLRADLSIKAGISSCSLLLLTCSVSALLCLTSCLHTLWGDAALLNAALKCCTKCFRQIHTPVYKVEIFNILWQWYLQWNVQMSSRIIYKASKVNMWEKVNKKRINVFHFVIPCNGKASMRFIFIL